MDIVTICSSPPAAGNAISTPNPACQGNPVTLDVTGHSFGTGQTYQWQEATSAGGPYTNLGGSQPTSSYSFTPATAKYYRAILTCSGLSDTSAVVQIPVATPVTPSVSIVTDTNNFCHGTKARFTATPVNGGSNPVYQWKKNGVNIGTDTNIFESTSLLNNDTITCEIVSNDACLTGPGAVSNKIVMIVISKLPTSVLVDTDPSKEICLGDSVVFTATPTNGGTSPSYQWKKNGVNVGNNSPIYGNGSLANNDVIRCQMTTSEECVTQPVVGFNTLMKVNPLPTKPLIQINGNILTSGGTEAGYQWNLNGVPLPDDTNQTIITHDSGWYSVTLISAKGCKITSNPVFSYGTVGIGEYSSNAIKIYPSPFDQELKIDFATGSKQHIVEVRNITGQLVQALTTAEQKASIDMSAQESGVYFITVKWEDYSDTRRIIKK